MGEPSAHYVVRVRANVDAARWWSAAADADDAPAVIRALLTGRSRVEVSGDEAELVRAWARAIDGWPDDGDEPLSFYPAAPAPC